MVTLARGFVRAVEPGVLRSNLAVDERRNVPGLLDRQAAFLTKRHVRADERSGLVDRGHASAPVERSCAPQWWVTPFAGDGLAGAILAVATGALFSIDSGAARVVCQQRGRHDRREAAAGRRHAAWQAARHERGIAVDGEQLTASERRRGAVQAVEKTVLRAFLYAVDLAIILAKRRKVDERRPHRRGASLAPGIEMAIAADKAVADVTRRQRCGICHQSFTQPNGIAVGVGGRIGGKRTIPSASPTASPFI